MPETEPAAPDAVQMRLRIHNAFKAKNLSIRAAERACDVGHGTFQKFIGGEHESIDAGNLGKIARLTGVPVEFLLFGEGRSPAISGTQSGAMSTPGARRVAHNLIRPSALNPRKRGFEPEKLRSLADSILVHGGLMQNLVVRPVEDAAAETGPYEIVAGERRWRAYALLIAEGKADDDVTLPCAVRALGDDEAMELMLVENMERQDLSPMEEGRAFLELWNRRSRALGKRKAGDVVKYLAERLHRSTRFVQKRIRLARDLVPAAQEALEDGKITLAHAEVLATAPKDAQTSQTVLLVAMPLEAQPTARAIGQSIASGLPDLALAVFNRSDYDADVFEFDGKDFAVDIPFFARLQDKAIAAKRAAYKRALADEDIAFLHEGEVFKQSLYTGVGEEDGGGVFIEVQDKGAWRVARVIEALARVSDEALAPATGRGEMFGDDDDGDGDDDRDAASDTPRHLAGSGLANRRDTASILAANEKQFGPLRAAFANRADLSFAVIVFEDVMFEVGDMPLNVSLRIGTDCPFPGDRSRAERTVTKLGLSWPSESDDVVAFAAQLLDKLLASTEGQLIRFVTQMIADNVARIALDDFNDLERCVFRAAGLDPDAAEAAAKEAA